MATACAKRLLQGTSISLHLMMTPNRSEGTFNGSTSSGAKVSSVEVTRVVSTWDFPTPICTSLHHEREKGTLTDTLAHIQTNRTAYMY